MAHIDSSISRISQVDFDDIFGTLASYFKARTTPGIDRQYYERVKMFPPEALRFAMERLIDDHRPAPGNFPRPTDLANLCHVWLDNHTELRHRMTVYHPQEDLDFPYIFLAEGFQVLINQGLTSFGRYVRHRRMPRNDVVRVLCKAAVCTRGPEKALIERAIKSMGAASPNVGTDEIKALIDQVAERAYHRRQEGYHDADAMG